ncbi:MAG: LolA family protein [Planctomycetota bacterium]|jgi:outer membrane lipoprotein-sorting protein
MKSPITKLAAATLIIAAALIAIYQFNGSLDRTIFTRVDSPGNVRKCKTLTWNNILLDKAMILRCMALEPYYVRVVWPNGKVWLVDRRKKKLIMMNPAKKTAKIMAVGREVPDIYVDIYDSAQNFKNMPGYSIERIGQRRIGQKQAIGFHLTNKKGNDQIIVWVDPHCQLPMHIEFFEANELGQMKPKIICSDIIFNAELDESLFRFDSEGYKVEGQCGSEVGDALKKRFKVCISAKTNIIATLALALGLVVLIAGIVFMGVKHSRR